MTLRAGHVVTGDSVVQPDEQQTLLRSDSSRQYGAANATVAVDEPVNQCQHQLSPSLPDDFYAKLAATTINFFVSGFAMSAIGALLSDIERHFQISDAQVALIFPAGVLGYLIATMTVRVVDVWGGRRAIAIVAAVLRLLAAMALTSRPPFPIVLASYAFFGYGTGVTDTAWNTWAGGMRRANVVQGILHGSFAVGCIFGPFVAAAVLGSYIWAKFYESLSILAFSELLAQGWAFRNDTRAQAQSELEAEEAVRLRDLLAQRSVWVMSIFYFFYQCVEASYTDWIVVFLSRRSSTGPAKFASASSIFWIGMALGRYSLGLLTDQIGVRIAVVMYCIASIVFQLCLTLVKQLGPTLAFIGACGFFLAPLFPSGIVLLAPDFSSQQRGIIVAFLIAMGQIGAAVAPLAVGVLATTLGIQYLIQVTLVFSVLMLATWLAILDKAGSTA